MRTTICLIAAVSLLSLLVWRSSVAGVSAQNKNRFCTDPKAPCRKSNSTTSRRPPTPKPTPKPDAKVPSGTATPTPHPTPPMPTPTPRPTPTPPIPAPTARPTPTSEPALAVSPPATFSVTTVTLDGNGKVAKRETKPEAMCHIITLGKDTLGKDVTLEVVWIPGDKFMMGSNDYNNEKPPHEVSMPGFYMGKYEVTQKQWRAVASLPKGKGVADLNSDPSDQKGDNLPVENVSWDDAQEFLRRLNENLKLPGKLKFRLPSEAEWEYAARGGTTTPFAFGEMITPEIVNYNGNYPHTKTQSRYYRGRTVAVGSLGVSNGFGLFDMHGNVWEWCEDIWHDNYDGAPANGSAWLDESSGYKSFRVRRGGSWINAPLSCRSTMRAKDGRIDRRNGIGFRIAVSARTS